MLNLGLIKKLLVIVIAIGVILAVLLFIYGLGNGRLGGAKTPAPQPSGAAPNDFKINQQDKDQVNKEYLVGLLMNKTPYKGTNFSLDYNFNNGTFVLILNKNAVNRGYSEFNAFLSKSGVQKAWITNLETHTQ